jgi:hypothetical protein
MTGGRTPSATYLIIRSLLPSAISCVLCVCFAIAVVGIHLLLLTLTEGTSLPRLLDGQWGLMYTDYVVGPIQQLVNNIALNNVLVIVLWGVAGLCVYALGDYCTYLFLDWWHAEHDIEMPAQGQTIYHPLRRMFITSMLWRLGVVCAAIGIFIAVQPLTVRAFKTGPDIILGNITLTHALYELALAILIWTTLAHCFVVLARLFLMRTRLFGDPEIN